MVFTELPDTLAIASDYIDSSGCPRPRLHGIAEAGFTHIHWCHHWNDDFVYEDCEVNQLKAWLDEFGLKMKDLHASHGREKCWYSPREYERQAGVSLVTNRIEMTSRLGGDVIVMHAAGAREDTLAAQEMWASQRRSLDELQPPARRYGVRIAVENGSQETVDRILAAYPGDYVGLCYDFGHGNMSSATGLGWLADNADRLIAVHVHDNDGQADQHKLPFTGTVDWATAMKVLARSSYRGPLTMEVSLTRSGFEEEQEVAFLTEAHEVANKLKDLRSSAELGGQHT